MGLAGAPAGYSTTHVSQVRTHPVERGARPRPSARDRPTGRGERLRLRVDLRPLPSVGRRSRPLARSCGRCSARSPSARRRIGVAVGVTCPIMRIHPAILAQATATTVASPRWTIHLGRRHRGGAQRAHPRRQLAAAPDRASTCSRRRIDVIRRLWTGDEVYLPRGALHRRERPPLRPRRPSRSPWSSPASATRPAEFAARIGDGCCGPPRGASDTIDTWKAAGGTRTGYSQIDVCWADDASATLDTVEAGVEDGRRAGPTLQDLPTPAHFDMAASVVRRDGLTSRSSSERTRTS